MEVDDVIVLHLRQYMNLLLNIPHGHPTSGAFNPLLLYILCSVLSPKINNTAWSDTAYTINYTLLTFLWLDEPQQTPHWKTVEIIIQFRWCVVYMMINQREYIIEYCIIIFHWVSVGNHQYAIYFSKNCPIQFDKWYLAHKMTKLFFWTVSHRSVGRGWPFRRKHFKNP